MQILGLFGMYFDAVVVEVKTFFTFIQVSSGHSVSEQLVYSFILNILELTTSCRLLRNKNPRDPWTNQGPIPLPNNEKMDKFLHYDQDTRPGCEEWHDPVDVPFSG
jgi:hypothetical protein